jgi:hypothetical protein
MLLSRISLSNTRVLRKLTRITGKRTFFTMVSRLSLDLRRRGTSCKVDIIKHIIGNKNLKRKRKVVVEEK